MNTACKFILFFLWIVCLYVCGILIFTKGFLLKRLEVADTSSCNVNFTSKQSFHGGEGCWSHRRFKRAVIIIIDALRYDFAHYDPSVDAEIPYRNKIKIFHELTTKYPQKARLYHFRADPPTTTMQRLKALSTGSLPTFVDAGANFAKTEISEDNFVDQLKRQGKKITFLGDDTWEGLYPGRFHKSFPFPSYNVKDLHTVDNAIIKNIQPELRRRDWDVLLAHFLGVDHCGHTYGSEHPAMPEKLKQMDKMLRMVVKEIDDETVLFVFGDHGMTRSGDHGGDSENEVDAALFVYSKSQITSTRPVKEDKTVSQVDFVPTLSLLLGVPIPYSNLGTVIVDLFNHCPWWKTSNNKVKQVFHTVEALRLNAHQVREYLHTYSQTSADFPRRKMETLNAHFDRLESDLQQLVTAIYLHSDHRGALGKFEALQKGYMNYLREVKAMCNDIWAKFDLQSMTVGLAVVVMAAAVSISILNCWTVNSMYIVLAGSVWASLLLAFVHFMVNSVISIVFSLTCGFLIIGIILVALFSIYDENPNKSTGLRQKIYKFFKGHTSETLFAMAAATVYNVSFFSNSFIVNEDAVTTFLSQTMVLLLGYRAAAHLSSARKSNSSSANKNPLLSDKSKPNLLKTQKAVLALLVCVNMALLRLTKFFWECREEQFPCDDSSFLQPLSTLADKSSNLKNGRYFLSVISVVSLVISLRYWMRHYGNLNGYGVAVLCAKYFPPVSTAALCFYWALQALPHKVLDSLPAWQIVSLPRVVYLLCLVSVVALITKPLCVYLLSPDSPEEQEEVVPMVTNKMDVIVPKVYNHLKVNWRKHLHSGYRNPDKQSSLLSSSSSSSDSSPVVYGLATVYSSVMSLLVVTFSLLLTLLLGDGMAPSTLILVCCMFVGLELHGCNTRMKHKELALPVPSFTVKWWSVFTWGILASQFFFSSGHQATIPSIKFSSAYHGFHGDFDIYAIPALLITMNTFSSIIIFTLASPLLIFWPLGHGELVSVFRTPASAEVQGQGEFILNEYSHGFQVALFKLTVAQVLFYGLKVLSTMCAAGLHRRHLMVWKIFAPRFIFEAASFLVVCVTSLLIYLFVLRVKNSVDNWVKKLEDKTR